MWKRLCQLLKIERRLSTSYHPETDGLTERINAEIETLLRRLVNHAQDDWANWLPAVQFALSGRSSSTTGVSSFFLSHGYHPDVLQLETPQQVSKPRSPIQQAEAIVSKIKEATEWAQQNMTAAQQDQEKTANRRRNPAHTYKVGDKVWLNLANYSTTRPSKKLDDRQAKYTVIEVVGPQSYRLNVPGSIDNVFNVDRLRPAEPDPLPSQVNDDYQPPAVVVDDDGVEEYEVEAIQDERRVNRGRKRVHEYLVKWSGWRRPTWEPADAVKETIALDDYLKQRQAVQTANTPRRRERKRGGDVKD